MKPANKANVSKLSDAHAAEPVEQRASAKENSVKPAIDATQRADLSMSVGLKRIREAARRDKSVQFTSLLHHVSVDMLREAYFALNKRAAVGIDDVTWQDYGKGLEERLPQLHEQVQKCTYRAKPSKRVWIPKGNGELRPIGIAALEDKIVQQALVWVLESIYEEDFMGFSYGYRPKRHAHKALDALYVAISQKKVSWVLDADLQGFFDSLDHKWMMKFLEHRVADRRVLRLIKKFLIAGVSDEGEWSKSEVGTPQGSVISPILANIYLHYAFDLWAQQWRTRNNQVDGGEVYFVRYADDFVVCFQRHRDGKRFLCDVKKRLEEFGLKLHPQKTRLIEFGRFASDNHRDRGQGKPESFDFLGFTHVCGKRLKDGRFMLKRFTNKKKVRNVLARIKQRLTANMHLVPWRQGQWLRRVLQGHFNYFAVPGNHKALQTVRTEANRIWRWVLQRRSQKSCMIWTRMRKLIETWIPQPKIKHPYPDKRFAV